MYVSHLIWTSQLYIIHLIYVYVTVVHHSPYMDMTVVPNSPYMDVTVVHHSPYMDMTVVPNSPYMTVTVVRTLFILYGCHFCLILLSNVLLCSVDIAVVVDPFISRLPLQPYFESEHRFMSALTQYAKSQHLQSLACIINTSEEEETVFDLNSSQSFSHQRVTSRTASEIPSWPENSSENVCFVSHHCKWLHFWISNIIEVVVSLLLSSASLLVVPMSYSMLSIAYVRMYVCMYIDIFVFHFCMTC